VAYLRILPSSEKQGGGFYGFTEEQLDFIVNYDVNYRTGQESGEDDGIARRSLLCPCQRARQNQFALSIALTGDPARRTSVYPKRRPCGFSCRAAE
jgi:hypothetical protein